MGQPDRESVSLEFKLSKNYNSAGGSISFSSDRKEGETDEELFQRVYAECEDKVNRLLPKAHQVLGI
jgi:hypothetical protein